MVLSSTIRSFGINGAKITKGKRRGKRKTKFFPLAPRAACCFVAAKDSEKREKSHIRVTEIRKWGVFTPPESRTSWARSGEKKSPFRFPGEGSERRFSGVRAGIRSAGHRLPANRPARSRPAAYPGYNGCCIRGPDNTEWFARRRLPHNIPDRHYYNFHSSVIPKLQPKAYRSYRCL